jgi:hypothetical protein
MSAFTAMTPFHATITSKASVTDRNEHMNRVKSKEVFIHELQERKGRSSP